MFRLSIILFAAWQAITASANIITITEDGVPQQYYLSPTDSLHPPNTTANGTVLNLQYSERFYVMTANVSHSSSTKSNFKLFSLVNRTIIVTVNLNGATCGCNAAFYLVSMPAPSSTPGDGKDWYCDANDVGGNSCPEIDLIECNQNALKTTMHHCDKPYSKQTCDGGGQGLTFGKGNKDFGIGQGFTIDTTQPFTVSNTFVVSGGHLENLVEIAQKNKVIHLIADNVDSIASPLADGMVLVFSFWGSSSMGWLDSPPCSGEPAKCPTSMTFSDIRVVDAAPLPPPPPPGPCPSSQGCDCSWTKGGSICPNASDDGSECFCRCCCAYRDPHTCKWQPGQSGIITLDTPTKLDALRDFFQHEKLGK